MAQCLLYCTICIQLSLANTQFQKCEFILEAQVIKLISINITYFSANFTLANRGREKNE
jgi:hypothetical protein